MLSFSVFGGNPRKRAAPPVEAAAAQSRTAPPKQPKPSTPSPTKVTAKSITDAYFKKVRAAYLRQYNKAVKKGLNADEAQKHAVSFMPESLRKNQRYGYALRAAIEVPPQLKAARESRAERLQTHANTRCQQLQAEADKAKKRV